VLSKEAGMSNEANATHAATGERTRRDRVGVSVSAPDIHSLLRVIDEAEEAGVAQLWMTQNPTSLDSLTVFAAAFGRTQRIRLGTSIVPTYPRHPLALAQQAASVSALGPARLRLGVGTSHRPTIEGSYGLTMELPLAHLREYVAVLRAALWEGEVAHQGRFFTARAKLSHTPRPPILVAALGEEAFRLAGEVSDGAISWNCPPAYLREVALLALRAGAAAAGRPTPPLVAHMWVALGGDGAAVVAAARQALAGYARLPFYANMFAAAGYPVEAGGVSDALVEQLVIQGSEQAAAQRLAELLDSGLDELLLTVVPQGDVGPLRTRLFRLIGQL
jgi:F420-dependent oxidoreductase-like protein